MATWGTDLWDQRESIERHSHAGLDFLDKCASFIKDRIRVEQEYAKGLRKIVKQYQYKKKEEDDLCYTYQHAYKNFLQEIDDYAGQREVIAESIHDKILKEMHKVSHEAKAERKKAISSLNDLKSHLDSLNKALQNSKRKYDQASEDADQAMKAYEQASQSLDLTKAQILKYQKTSQDKGHQAERARDDYSDALDKFNKEQTLYYQANFPNCVNNEMQKPEEKRIDFIGKTFQDFANIHQQVVPIIGKCLEGMTNAGKSCDSNKDSLTLIDKCKTGESVPPSVLFEEWGKPGQNLTAKVTPSPSIRGKAPKPSKGSTLFGISNKKREVMSQEGIANDFAELPPAQRRKKFNKKIAACENEIAQLEKAGAAITKMTETVTQFGGDMASLEAQQQENAKEIQKAQGLLYQYQCYLAAMDNTTAPAAPANIAPVVAPVSQDVPPPPPLPGMETTDFPAPPPPEPTFAPSSPGDTFGDEFDEPKCHVLYDFPASNEGELSIYAGEELIIVEDDDGSGWARVVRGDEEGYIPSSYIERE